MLHFFLEVRGQLGELWEGGHVELVITLDGVSAQLPDPALLINPALGDLGPVGAIGMHAFRNGEGSRIELKDGDVGELVAVRVKELVVVNVGVLSEDPLLIGTQVSLRGLAFDLVAKSVLALIGVGELRVVENKESAGEHYTGEEQWECQAIEADAASL